jgi:hypothetical protein
MRGEEEGSAGVVGTSEGSMEAEEHEDHFHVQSFPSFILCSGRTKRFICSVHIFGRLFGGDLSIILPHRKNKGVQVCETWTDDNYIPIRRWWWFGNPGKLAPAGRSSSVGGSTLSSTDTTC